MTMPTWTARLVGTNASEDAALRALFDCATLMPANEEYCIVGGQMSAILAATFISEMTMQVRAICANLHNLECATLSITPAHGPHVDSPQRPAS